MALMLYSCDDNMGIGSIDNPQQYSTIYMPRAANSSTKKIVLSDTTYHFQYSAYFGGPVLPKNDIHITFDVNMAAVDSFNKKNGTNYILMPEGSYTLEANSATIPAGRRSTSLLALNIDASNRALELQTYVLPVSITNIEGTTVPVSGSFGTDYFIFQGSYRQISKKDWKIIGYDSYQNSNTAPNKAIDGNQKTYWHTPWTRPRPAPPHYISVDMGEEHLVHGFKIIGRLGKAPFFSQGNPKDIVIKVSSDTTNWGKGEHFTLPFDVNTVKTKVYFTTPMKGRYFKIIVNSTFLNKKFTHIAEIYAF